MKRTTLLLAGCAVLLVSASAWTSGARANPAGEAATGVDLPLHRSCVVTVDPRIGPKPEYPGAANAISGFFAPDTARGTLIRLDSQWLVLRDGHEENWIPREKVLMIRASRQVHP